ncbi:uncharacterized protein LOC120355509 [Nilaparvata lugens]|uniref:uncharacterized protein LOC120355509 n=1 Tax=Nilaparvata lugens TaxID=108931 RepID=UPI00193DAC99|nr:uncharacterized protein LOC120355509 [Nilaparvata lugens]
MVSAVPVAFFLMKRKTEDSYRRVLSHMRENFLNWNFTTITTDYEVGLVNAIRAVFPEARHIGCWFHFCQAIWRYVVAEGLTALIRADFEVKKVVKMLMALPHLPPHPGPPHDDRVPPYGIADGLNAISNYIDEGNLDRRLQNAVAYVRRYWVGVIGVESLSTFQAPRRTNNHLESFHSRMLAAFGVNLDIWSFLRRLRTIEAKAFGSLQRADRGNRERMRDRSGPENNSDIIRSGLRRLVRQEVTLINFLALLAHCVDNIVDMGLQENDIDNEYKPAPLPSMQSNEYAIHTGMVPVAVISVVAFFIFIHFLAHS